MSVREQSLVELRKRLQKMEKAGSVRLPAERALAGELGVSRRALRQALDLLEAEGRIWRHVGRGTFLGSRPPVDAVQTDLLATRTNPLEVLVVRRLLEPQIASLAALYATTADVARIRNCEKKCAGAPDLETFELWDNRLHVAIAEAAHNALLLALFSAVIDVRKLTDWGKLKAASFSASNHRVYASDHRRLIDAIAERDAQGAEQAMRLHLDSVEQHLFRQTPMPSARFAPPAGERSRQDQPTRPTVS